jgi:hypothetical protein
MQELCDNCLIDSRQMKRAKGLAAGEGEGSFWRASEREKLGGQSARNSAKPDGIVRGSLWRTSGCTICTFILSAELLTLGVFCAGAQEFGRAMLGDQQKVTK